MPGRLGEGISMGVFPSCPILGPLVSLLYLEGVGCIPRSGWSQASPGVLQSPLPSAYVQATC